MNYPSIKEYIEAIRFAEDNFDQLKHLRPVLGGDGKPVMTSGNFAVVFQMKDEQTGKLHAVKCFLREQEGRAEAYRQIAEELEYVSSTFLTPIKYLDNELFVDTNAGDDKEFPVLLMDWVEGDTLDKYIRKHLDDQYELSLLAYQFSRLAMWLMPQPFAHGDLKPDNILVKSDGTLVLVDYDGMYVPAMKGQKARELGSPDFRHPSRTETDFDEHIDDFSLASILLSLKAISLQPELLEKYGASDRLLFSEKDYRNLSESRVMDALKPLMQDAEQASLYSLFILALSQNNLSRVSFRLFSLSRPTKKSLRVLQIKKKIVNQSDKKVIKKELLSSFQGKDNVWHIVVSNGTESYLTQECSFVDEIYLKGANKLNTVENDKKHVLFLFNDKDAEVGRYYLGKKLQGLTPARLIEIKHEIVVFESWNPETKKWVPCVGKSKESENKQKSENEDLRTKVTNEDLANSWTDEHGVMYSSDRKRLLRVPHEIKDFSKRLPTIINEYTIKEETEIICNSAFERCVGLKRIIIPYGVTHIGRYAFWCCQGIETLVLPDSLIEIGQGAFYECIRLNTLELSDNIKKIGHNAFEACSNLESITIPNSVADFGNSIFQNCSKLHSVTLPVSIKSVGDACFSACYNLDEIVIPKNVVRIGANAFLGCGRLKKVWLSDKVSFIDPSAFVGCAKLEYIFIPDNTFVRFEKLLPRFREKLMEKVTIDNHEGLRRVFSKEEIEFVNKALVVQGTYTKLVCFYMNDGCQTYKPLSKQSKLSIGDFVDLQKARLIEFNDEGIFYGDYVDGEYVSKYIVEA